MPFRVHDAIERGNDELAIRLIEGGEALEEAELIKGDTPLLRASRRGRTSVVSALLMAQANVETTSRGGATPLLLAAQEGHRDALELLIHAGAEVDVKDSSGYMPVHLAALNGRTATLELLIANAMWDHQMSNGATAVYIAAMKGQAEALELLIEAQADVDTPVSGGATPVLIAAANGQAKTLELLIAAGAKLDTPTSSGATPLYVAAQKGQLGTLELLIAAKASVHSHSAGGATPVYIAAMNGQRGALELLLGAGADVDTPASSGATPVLMAALKGHAGVLELLLCAGADPSTKGEDGTTPLDAAESSGHLRCAAVLRLASLQLKVGLSREDLCALVQPGALEAALPSAFHTSPLQALEQLASLVGECRVEARRVGALDVTGGEELLASVIRAQLLAVGLLRAVPPARMQQELTSPEGTQAIRALTIHGCKLVLADGLIQQVIDARWRFRAPRSVKEAAFIASHSLGQLCAIACFPPFTERLEAECEACRVEAAQEVERENPEPDRPEEDEFVLFKVNGAIVAGSWSGTGHEADWDRSCATFLECRAAAAAAEATLEARFFISVQPQTRFFLSVVFQLLFALLLAMLPSEGAPFGSMLLLLWALQLLASKLLELYGDLQLWLLDWLNGLELVASSFGCLAVILRPVLPNAAYSAQAASIVLIWTTQSARVLQQSPVLGPLVLTARELIGETLRFLLLIAGSLIGFSCSFYVLFKAGVNEFEPGCAVLQSTEGNSVLGAGLFLLETILGNDNQLDCLRGSRHPGLAAGLMDAFLFVFLLLGVNMLIALMVKKVDRDYEQQKANYMHLSALTFVWWSNARLVPPPFMILAIPYYFFKSALDAPYRSFFLKCLWDPNKHELLKEPAPKGLIEDLPVSKLKELMEQHVEAHAGEPAEDHMWRKQMRRQQAQTERQVTLVVRQQEQMAAHQVQMVHQMEQMEEHIGKQQRQILKQQEQMGKHLAEVVKHMEVTMRC